MASFGSNVHIEDRRQITLTVDVLLDALLEFDRKGDGWLWRASGPSLTVEAGEEPSVAVQARRASAEAPERMIFSRAHVGAAIIHYCWLQRIPLPRNARKEIEITPDKISLIILMTIDKPRMHRVDAPEPPSVVTPSRD